MRSEIISGYHRASDELKMDMYDIMTVFICFLVSCVIDVVKPDISSAK